MVRTVAYRGLMEQLGLAVRGAAGDRTVTIAGGASAVRQGLQRGVVDEIMLSHVPGVLGAGERIFDGVPALQAEPVEVAASPLATHVVYCMSRI